MKVKGLLMLAGAALLIAGCQLSHPGWSSLAFEEIKGVPMERIRDTILQVFAEEGYKVALPGRTRLVFKREGTMHDRLKYGRYQEELTMRVEVSLRPYEGGVLVRLDAFALQGGEERGSVPVSRLVSWPYSQLLERVKARAVATISNEVKDQKQGKPSEVKP